MTVTLAIAGGSLGKLRVGMADRGVGMRRVIEGVVSGMLSDVERRLLWEVFLDEGHDGLLASSGCDRTLNFCGVPSEGTDNRWAVTRGGASPARSVGPRPRRVILIIVVAVALLSGILVDFINCVVRLREVLLGGHGFGEGLQVVTPLQQLAGITRQLLRQMRCPLALGKAAQPQEDGLARVAEPIQRRSRKAGEPCSTLPAPVVHHWCPFAGMGGLVHR